jgi:hypothetical protein
MFRAIGPPFRVTAWVLQEKFACLFCELVGRRGRIDRSARILDLLPIVPVGLVAVHATLMCERVYQANGTYPLQCLLNVAGRPSGHPVRVCLDLVSREPHYAEVISRLDVCTPDQLFEI